MEPKGPLRGPLAGLLELPRGCVLLLHGPRGGGKTSIGLAALGVPAGLEAPRPYVVTSEMAPSLVNLYASRMGLELAGCVEPDPELDALGRLRLNVPASFTGDVLLDSLTRCVSAELALEELRAYARSRNVRAIGIAQWTKDGDMRGPASLGHDVDAVAMVEHGRIVVTKNRFGPERSRTFVLEGAGATLPTWDRYYSIEGEGPDLRIVSWPSDRARYADPYRHAKGLELPPPPLATAAQKAELYAGGWVEPSDVERRCEFAREHGLNFWTPLRGLINHADGPRGIS